jgi:hypothetical protein
VCTGVFLTREILPKRKIKNNYFWKRSDLGGFHLPEVRKLNL